MAPIIAKSIPNKTKGDKAKRTSIPTNLTKIFKPPIQKGSSAFKVDKLFHHLKVLAVFSNIPFLDQDVDPFCSISVLCGALVFERSYFLSRIKKVPVIYRLPLFDTIIICLALSLFFEFVFPRITHLFFYDPYDFLSYLAGMFYFYFFINPEKETSNSRFGNLQ
ncbi:MAG: hypothetical protein WAT92_04445 [Saprospiraceae bacterium]